MPQGTNGQPYAQAFALMPAPLPIADMVEQSALFQTMMHAARKMNKVGFGLHGSSIPRVVETVPLRRLWCNPVTPARFTEEQLAAMANSLFLNGQKEPLAVVPLLNPDETRARFGKLGDLLVTDGRLRYHAAPLKAIEQLDVIVYDPPGTPYHLLLDVVTRKLSQHELPEEEAADWALALAAQYRVVLEQHPEMPRLTQAKLAALVGVSQPRLNRLLRIRALPKEIIILRQAGLLDETHAVELLPLAEQNPASATTVAQQIADATAHGLRPSREHTRELVRAAQKQQGNSKRRRLESGPLVLDADSAIDQQSRQTLWLSQVATLPLEDSIACLIHDLENRLAAVTAGRERPATEVKMLLRALRAPAIQAFVQTRGRVRQP